MDNFKKVILLFLFILCSCKQLSLSNQEKEAISKIVELYGGTCTYTLKVDALGSNDNYFQIEINNSDFLNQTSTLGEMHISNIAFIFFKYINNDKIKYHKIKSSIVYKNQAIISSSYTIDTFKLVDHKLKNVLGIIDILKNQDYQQISLLLKKGGYLNQASDNNLYINRIKYLDSTFGKIISFSMTGFKFNKPSENVAFLHISGNLKREVQDSQFSIDLSSDINNNDIYLLGYDY